VVLVGPFDARSQDRLLCLCFTAVFGRLFHLFVPILLAVEDSSKG
jgi:hypothetical protein